MRRAIELALLKRPAADQRVDASGLRIHGGDAAADIGDLAQRELGYCRSRRRAALAGRSSGAGNRLDEHDIAGLQHIGSAADPGAEPLIVKRFARPAQLV